MRYSLRALLAIATCFALILGVGVPIFRQSQAAAQAKQIRNSMRSVGLGILNHVSAKQHFPPPSLLSVTGEPLTSWRFQIVPFLTQLPIDGSVGWHRMAHWQDSKNRPLDDFLGDFYVWSAGNQERWSNLFGVAGPGTAFDPDRPTAEADCPLDVILCMEVVRSKTNWMQPGDYDVTELLSYSGRIGDHLRGLLPDRFHVLFADGEVWSLSPAAPMAALHPFLTIAGAKSHDRDQLLAPHRVE